LTDNTEKWRNQGQTQGGSSHPILEEGGGIDEMRINEMGLYFTKWVSRLRVEKLCIKERVLSHPETYHRLFSCGRKNQGRWEIISEAEGRVPREVVWPCHFKEFFFAWGEGEADSYELENKNYRRKMKYTC